MTAFIISLLTISQIVSFYLIFSRLKPKVVKQEGLVLKPLKKSASYEDVDPNSDLIYDVLKTIKIEDWNLNLNIDPSMSRKSFELVFTSKDGKTSLRSRLSVYSNDVRLVTFIIVGNNGSISVKSESPINNDIILFLWDYIVDHYEKEHEDGKSRIKSAVCGIKDSLITIKRSDRLNKILNG